jgi:hypothetical protein
VLRHDQELAALTKRVDSTFSSAALEKAQQAAAAQTLKQVRTELAQATAALTHKIEQVQHATALQLSQRVQQSESAINQALSTKIDATRTTLGDSITVREFYRPPASAPVGGTCPSGLC